MDDKQSQMWDKLCELDGETVARLLTYWHGLQLLDDGFYGHMVEEGYICGPEEENNCENESYDCDSCVLSGRCDRETAMEAAMRAEKFEDFCAQFQACNGCPFAARFADCEDDL